MQNGLLINRVTSCKLLESVPTAAFVFFGLKLGGNVHRCKANKVGDAATSRGIGALGLGFIVLALFYVRMAYLSTTEDLLLLSKKRER